MESSIASLPYLLHSQTWEAVSRPCHQHRCGSIRNTGLVTLLTWSQVMLRCRKHETWLPKRSPSDALFDDIWRMPRTFRLILCREACQIYSLLFFWRHMIDKLVLQRARSQMAAYFGKTELPYKQTASVGLPLCYLCRSRELHSGPYLLLRPRTGLSASENEEIAYYSKCSFPQSIDRTCDADRSQPFSSLCIKWLVGTSSLLTLPPRLG